MSTNPIIEELLACPFCGGNEIGNTGKHSLAFVCMSCGAIGPTIDGDTERASTWEGAAAAWNRRAADSRANQAAIDVIDTLVESLDEGLMTDAGLTKADISAMKHQVEALNIAKDEILALPAAALSRAEGQEPEAYLHKPTGNVFKAAEFRPLLTAWQRQFADTHAAEEIEADFLPLYRSALVKASAPAVPDGWSPHQHRVAAWMLECFGPKIAMDKIERADRFIEEALELTQATGWTPDRGHALVDYVFGRPVGEIGQEVGGVMVTLAAFCNALDVNIHAEAEREVDRITQPDIVLKIRAKQAAKPTGSALPVATPSQPLVRGEGE